MLEKLGPIPCLNVTKKSALLRQIVHVDKRVARRKSRVLKCRYKNAKRGQTSLEVCVRLILAQLSRRRPRPLEPSARPTRMTHFPSNFRGARKRRGGRPGCSASARKKHAALKVARAFQALMPGCPECGPAACRAAPKTGRFRT